MNWKGLASAAALAVLACGSAAFASQEQQAGSFTGGSQFVNPQLLDDMTTMPATAPASAPAETTLTPVMFLLDPTPVGQWLEKNKITFSGFVDGGYFYNTSAPRISEQPTDIVFPGPFSNRALLDQIDFSIQKQVDTTQKNFDFGFMFENLYGTDGAYIHSHGILDNRPPKDPQNQYDIDQAFATLFIPVGNGLTLKAGKFVTLLGNETISPLTNQFYSHSYNFSYGIPFTQMGLLAAYTFPALIGGKDLSVNAGFTRGWNQSFRDNNGAIDFLGEVTYSPTDKLALTMNLSEGPEATNDNSDYWTVVEGLAAYTVSDQLTVTGDFLYGDFPHGATTNPGQSEQWYGAVGYAGYKINSYFTLNARGEWYRDQGGFTVGTQANYYELTLGTQIHPLPNDNIFQYLQIRPEIRGDAADRRVFNSSHSGGGDYSELTAAVDVIMQF